MKKRLGQQRWMMDISTYIIFTSAFALPIFAAPFKWNSKKQETYELNRQYEQTINTAIELTKSEIEELKPTKDSEQQIADLEADLKRLRGDAKELPHTTDEDKKSAKQWSEAIRYEQENSTAREDARKKIANLTVELEIANEQNQTTLKAQIDDANEDLKKLASKLAKPRLTDVGKAVAITLRKEKEKKYQEQENRIKSINAQLDRYDNVVDFSGHSSQLVNEEKQLKDSIQKYKYESLKEKLDLTNRKLKVYGNEELVLTNRKLKVYDNEVRLPEHFHQLRAKQKQLKDSIQKYEREEIQKLRTQIRKNKTQELIQLQRTIKSTPIANQGDKLLEIAKLEIAKLKNERAKLRIKKSTKNQKVTSMARTTGRKT